MDEQPLSLYLEWYDPQSDQLKPYLLHYYGDQTLELIERLTKRPFLKRIRVPTIKPADLYIGGVITVYSRQLTILEPANEYTKNMLARQTNKALVVITPSGYSHMGSILRVIEQSEVVVLNVLMMQLERSQLAALNAHLVIEKTRPDEELLRDVSVLVEVKHPTPNTLEAAISRLDGAGLRPLVHIVNAGLELVTPIAPAAKGRDQTAAMPTTAVLDNCTLCLIRPRMLREGRVGEILQTILSAGFEISAMKTMHLRTRDADEFFQVYKGIVRQYHEILKYMCSAPCIALEIRGDDVVRRFREICGPVDVQIAQTLRPTSLRARFGKSNLHNAVHCTDCPEDGVLECHYIFQSIDS